MARHTRLFAHRQLMDKCQEQNMGLYATFVYLTKAFDLASWTGLLLFLETTWLSAKLSTECDPAAREPAWPDQTQ